MSENGAPKAAASEAITLLRSIAESIAEMSERIEDMSDRLPEDIWYCPKETAASYAKRRGGKSELPDDHVICPGGFRLRRHPKKYSKEDPEAARDDLYHSLPPDAIFQAEYPSLGSATVKNHKVWKSAALTAEAASAAGLTLRNQEDATADVSAPPRPAPSSVPPHTRAPAPAPAPARTPAPVAAPAPTGEPVAADPADIGARGMAWVQRRYGDEFSEQDILGMIGVADWESAIALHGVAELATEIKRLTTQAHNAVPA